MNKLGLIGIGIIVGLAITLVGGWFLMDQNYQYHGVLIDPPAQAADFELTDQNGQPFRLSDQRGKIAVIFFGYTNCPDICPTTLGEFRKIHSQLGSKADQVEFIYITVDPERDSVERMKAYVQAFNPDFIGLTGEPSELEKVWKDYGVYHAKQNVDSAVGYVVDHSTRTYVIDSQGNWKLNFPFGMDSSLISQDLLHLIREQ
jgi:protein SCO1/2